MHCLQNFAVGCFTFCGWLRIGWRGCWRERRGGREREGTAKPQNRRLLIFEGGLQGETGSALESSLIFNRLITIAQYPLKSNI